MNRFAITVAVVVALIFASCGVAYHVVDTRPLHHKLIHLPTPAPSAPAPSQPAP